MSASIFISHSAKDVEGRTYLDAIAHGLRAAAFDVWLDQARLKGGDDWGVVIANLMAECHGAVALFSTAALESEYFRFEVSNLFARWTREQADATLGAAQRFRFCPIVVHPVTVEGLKTQSFVTATYLGAVNWIAPRSAADAVTRLVQAFEGLTGWPSPLQGLEAAVAAMLARITEPAVHLDAARDAGFGPADLGAPAEYPIRLARLFLRCPIDRLCVALRRLGNVLSAEEVLKLFDLLAPSWVSFEAGCRFEAHLCLTGAQAPAGRFAAINGTYPEFTPTMYLLRARRSIRNLAGHVVTVASPQGAGLSREAFLRDTQTELATFVRRLFSRRPPAGDLAAELAGLDRALASGDSGKLAPLLAKFINRIVVAGGAVIVAVPAAPVDFDVIREVSARPELSRVTFVALTGLERPDAPHDAHVIVPELSPAHEDLAYDAYQGFSSVF